MAVEVTHSDASDAKQRCKVHVVCQNWASWWQSSKDKVQSTGKYVTHENYMWQDAEEKLATALLYVFSVLLRESSSLF